MPQKLTQEIVTAAIAGYEEQQQVRQTLVDVLSEDAVTIVDQEAVGMIARQRFPELLQCPFRREMGRCVLVENLAGSDLYDDEDVEGAKGGRDHHEEVGGHYGFGMITDEAPRIDFNSQWAFRRCDRSPEPA